MIAPILLAVVSILFIVAIIFAARVWRAATVTVVVMLFLATATYMVLGGLALFSHKTLRELAAKYEERIKQEDDKREQLINGVPVGEKDLTEGLGKSGTDATGNQEPNNQDAPVDGNPTGEMNTPPAGDTKPAENKEEENKPAENKEGETKPAENKEADNKEAEPAALRGRSRDAGAIFAQVTPLAFLQDDAKPEEKTKPDENKPEEKPQEEKPEEKAKPDDAAPADDTKPDDGKPEEKKPEEKKPEEKKPEETKPAETAPMDEAPMESPVANEATPATDRGPIKPRQLQRPGISQLRRQIQWYRKDRGAVWEGMGKIEAAGATFIAETASPGILKKGTIVYAFETKEKGIFLGELMVTDVKDKTILMEFTIKLNDDEKKVLAGRDGKWLVADFPPIDSHEAFVGVSRDELAKKWFADQPPSVIDEYALDGTKTAPKDQTPEQLAERMHYRVRAKANFTVDGTNVKVVDESVKDAIKAGTEFVVDPATYEVMKANVEVIEKIFVRPLRRYEIYWHDAHQRRTLASDRTAQLTADTAKLAEAHKLAQEMQMKREKVKTDLQADATKLGKDRDAIQKHLEELTKLESDYKAAISTLMTKNREAAAAITKWQVEMARKINAAAEGKPAAKTARSEK